MDSSINALILAAGSSRRMGEPKQLLDFHGQYLLKHVIKQILSFPFKEVVAVIGHEAERIEGSIEIDDKRFQWVFSPDYLLGQSFSMKEGLKRIGRASNLMVFLGDQPLISDTTILTIMEAGAAQFKQSATLPFSVQPTYEGEPGHPVFFGNIHHIDFSIMSGDQGAKNVLKSINTRILIPLADSGVLLDLDTKEDYQNALKITSD
jgi:molybdenum cofactor cytidylyltransferase